jgi:hypothetical protein
MKLTTTRTDNDVDSDQEERNGLAQDRMRLKKNISASGNYQLTKVVQPAQGAATTAPGQTGQADDKNRSASVGAQKGSSNAQLEKLKKNNLTASNPIIGAPLGTQSTKKIEKILPHVQIKSKDPKAAGKSATVTSQMTKPALANTKIPKYTKKTLKFAKGVEGGDSPGRNSNAE